MKGNTLYNVPNPVNPQDVATKEYADNVRGGGWVRKKKDGTYAIKRDLDMNDKRLKNIPSPVEDADAVNKIYVDTLSDETKRYVNSVTPFVNQQYEYAATNNINMRDFTLQNVGEPTNAKDVATKEYVDNSGRGVSEVRNGGYNAKGTLYIRGYKIGGVRDPKKDGEATNKSYRDNYVEKYVNDYVEKFKDGNGFFALPWDINMMGKKLSSLSFPSKIDEAATREYVDKVGNDAREYTDRSSELLGERFSHLQFAFLKANGFFAAHTPISMALQMLRDLAECKKTSDAVSKKYVDDLIADNVGDINGGGGSPFFKENGNYQATYAINMAFKKLLNLSTPSKPYEAATKNYVDDSIIKVEEKINNNSSVKSLIWARYKGALSPDDGNLKLNFFGKEEQYFLPVQGVVKKVMIILKTLTKDGIPLFDPVLQEELQMKVSLHLNSKTKKQYLIKPCVPISGGWIDDFTEMQFKIFDNLTIEALQSSDKPKTVPTIEILASIVLKYDIPH